MLKRGEKQGRDIPRKGTLGIPAAPCLGEEVGQYLPCGSWLEQIFSALHPLLLCVELARCLHRSLSPCLRQALGRVVCPRLSLPPGGVPMCANAQAGGDGANSFLRLTRNRLMARSSDYSYLSPHNGNHILKLPGFF